MCVLHWPWSTIPSCHQTYKFLKHVLARNKHSPLWTLKTFYWECEFPVLFRLNKHQQKPHRNQNLRVWRASEIPFEKFGHCDQQPRGSGPCLQPWTQRKRDHQTRDFCVWLGVPSSDSCFSSLEIHPNSLWSCIPKIRSQPDLVSHKHKSQTFIQMYALYIISLKCSIIYS